MMMAHQVPEGQMTASIYNMISANKFNDATVLLLEMRQSFPKSRAALSLLAYCQYMMDNFAEAAESYSELTKLHPEVESYRLYLAQCLYKACEYEEAMKASLKVQDDTSRQDVIKLQAAIKYGEEDLSGARSLIEQCPVGNSCAYLGMSGIIPDDPDTLINQACIMFSEGLYKEACTKFNEAMTITGYQSDLSYNIALCHYRLREFAPALKGIADIIERGIREHPELSVGMTTEGIDVRSVGNSLLLHETSLVEAFNLKAAIEYTLKNFDAATEALTDMPPRDESELDPVSLHNQALMNMESEPAAGFEKLQFLLQQNPCPPETFGNLLLLYCKHEHYDLAADVLAENAHLTFKLLSQYTYDYLDATITQQTSPEEAFRKFDDMANDHMDELRKLTNRVQEVRARHEDESMKQAVNDYDSALERYIPVLMAQAKIYWDRNNYRQVEKLFRKSVEFCNENDVWKLNVAHVLFMQAVNTSSGGQESKYKESIGFYEPIVKKNYANILDISAIVLANLCVAYIMTSQNEQAEEVMRKIEKEEENLAYEDPDRKVYHLCIVNLVIGTLYCAKGNFQFGVSRVIKSLEPYQKKLGFQTWFYAKRCFCALIENMAKQMIMINDQVAQDIIDFFEMCEVHGRLIRTVEDLPFAEEDLDAGKHTVTYEARMLRHLMQRLV